MVTIKGHEAETALIAAIPISGTVIIGIGQISFADTVTCIRNMSLKFYRMNHLAGFVILLFAALLLIVSSVTSVKVIAQGNGSSSEKPGTAAKTCSSEQFKEQPGFCAVIAALAHKKESGASAEKPSETGTIISAPIEVKKGPIIQEKKAGECPAGQAKDWAGICFPLKECKASISAQPGTCTQSEEEKTTGMLTAEKLEIKKPVTSSNPEPENCLKTDTRSIKSLCLTARAMPNLSYAYQAGWQGAKDGQNSYRACIKIPEGLLKDCYAGWRAYKDSVPVNNGEKAVPEQNCNGPAGTNNGIGSAYSRCLKP